MIIGIDETGNFSTKSVEKSFFIAVLIDQSENGLEKKRKQFNDWFLTIPVEKINEKGEIKGSDLNDDELLSFVNNVYNQTPITKVEVSSFDPKENSEETMQKFKMKEVNALLNDAQLFRKNGQEKKAKRIEGMAFWFKNRKKMNYNHFFKLMLLKSVICNSFVTAIGNSILIEMCGNDKKSSNLLGLKFKIDKDFIKGNEATKNWKKLLEKAFIQFTRKKPIPALENWKSNGHPFLEKYKTTDSNKLNFKEIFTQNCDFKHSHKHFEIQIADITGIIINRYINHQKSVLAFNALWEKNKIKRFHKIQLNI